MSRLQKGSILAFDPTARPRRDENLVSRTISGETVLIPIRSGAADLDCLFVLNPTAAHAWQLLDGSRTLTEVVDSVLENFDVDRARAQSDVDGLVESLRTAGLVHI